VLAPCACAHSRACLRVPLYVVLVLVTGQATQVSDVLAVQRELTAATAAIESERARAQYLERTSALSLLTVTLNRPYPTPPPPPPRPWLSFSLGRTLSRAVRALGRMISGALEAAVWAVVVVLPLAAIAGILLWTGARWVRVATGVGLGATTALAHTDA
jgi:hypothetical protein